MITANGRRNNLQSLHASFNISSIDIVARHKINDALVVEHLPSLDFNFPSNYELQNFSNTHDLAYENKFPNLPDCDLQLIIGMKEVHLITFD